MHSLTIRPFISRHIKEHLDDIVQKKEEEMTDEELQFHYFKLHDYNDDNRLDGCEIFKAMSHAYNGGWTLRLSNLICGIKSCILKLCIRNVVINY